MSKKRNNGATTLDLGIQAILERAQTTSPSDNTELTSTISPTAIYTLSDADGEFSAECALLAKNKQWGILVSRAEAVIADEDEIEARLWWIRGHLGALSLPVSLLAAPFESLCKQLATHHARGGPYEQLVKEIADILRDRLRGVGDRRQEHAVMLAVAQLGLYDPGDGPSPAWGKIPPKVPSFELGTPTKRSSDEDLKGQHTSRAPKSRRGGAALLACALLLVGFAGVWLFCGNVVDANVEVASEALLSHQSPPGLEAPSVAPLSTLSNLGALFYSISASDGSGVGGGENTSKTQAKAKQTPPNNVGKTSPRPELPAASQRPPASSKETINTQGPVEGSEFRQGIEGRFPREPRLPEPGYGVLPKAVPSNQSPEIGGVILGEVKSVLVTTSVLDSPSYRARVIAKLREGDKVSVEARVGRWVRIRSRRGKTGYVFAQDVGEFEDFRTPGG